MCRILVHESTFQRLTAALDFVDAVNVSCAERVLGNFVVVGKSNNSIGANHGASSTLGNGESQPRITFTNNLSDQVAVVCVVFVQLNNVVHCDDTVGKHDGSCKLGTFTTWLGWCRRDCGLFHWRKCWSRCVCWPSFRIASLQGDGRTSTVAVDAERVAASVGKNNVVSSFCDWRETIDDHISCKSQSGTSFILLERVILEILNRGCVDSTRKSARQRVNLRCVGIK
mmetsp:Transcript_27381/g.40114  ORF Transcript_27381/g.40114 Transcript_27381/m.40114 type:complete len:227 (+) Transcript_27381:890-1570(+)